MRLSIVVAAVALFGVVLFASSSVSSASANEVECGLCQYLVGQVERVIESQTAIEDIEKLLDKACDVLPGQLSGVCTSVVNQYTPQLIQWILNKEAPATACAQLGLCSKTSKKQVESKPQPKRSVGNMFGGAIECSLCKLVVGEVYKIIGDNHTEAAISAALDKVCDLLPSALSGPCDTLVNAYTPMIINVIMADLPPDAACQKIGLCSSANIVADASERQAKVSQTPVKGAIECSLCKLVIGEVEKLIGSNRSEAAIEAALDKVCGILPGPLSSPCEALVNQYAPQIINLLVNDFPADVVCQKLGLCTSSATKEAAKKPISVGGALECSLCKIVINEVENLIGSNRSEAAIEAALDKVCNVLPSALAGACQALVNQYAPQIINLLVNEFPADVICQKIGLCASAAAQTVAAPKLKNDLLCPLCEYVVKIVEDLIQGNRSVSAIEAALEKVCNFLPSSLRGTCDSFVEEYAPALIELLVRAEPPEKICAQIGACSSTSRSSPVRSSPAPNDFKCAACEYIASLAEQFISSNRTEQEIVSFVEKVCKFLPGSLQAECDQIIESYGPAIIDFLINKEDPKTLCSQIGLCARASVAAPVKKVSSSPNDFKCAACEYIAHLAEEFVAENRTEAEIIAFVDKVCTFLPSSLGKECDAIVQTYGPTIVQYLLNKEDPQTLCSQIGLCARKAAVSAPKKASPNSLVCPLCEYVVGYLEKLITENSTETEITHLVEEICNVAPSSLRNECDALIEEYGPYLISYLIDKEPPSKFCGQIGVCKSTDVKKTAMPNRRRGIRVLRSMRMK